MSNGRYGNLLTILLVAAIVAVIGLLTFLGIDLYNKSYLGKEQLRGVEQFDSEIPSIGNNANENTTSELILNPIVNETVQEELVNPFANTDTSTSTSTSSQSSSESSSGSSKTVYYKGFVQKGTISISRTGLNCPILENASKKAMEVAVGIQVGPGLNEVGNTVIAGHNYNNGTLFSKNKNIQVGDKINIKDTSGRVITYIVYNKFETTPEDASYINRDTGGKREITLYSCNDDSSKRIIIEAKEQ